MAKLIAHVMCLLVVLTSAGAALSASDSNSPSPVLIFPGYRGSQLEARWEKAEVRHAWCVDHIEF